MFSRYKIRPLTWALFLELFLLLSMIFLFHASFVKAEVTPEVGNIVKDVSEMTELYSTIIPLGSRAPDFSLKDFDGKVWDSREFIGKEVTLLYFWSAFCPYCKESLPKINQVDAEFRVTGLKTFAINLDGADFERAILKFIEDYDVTLPILLDELTGEKMYFNAADPYGVNKTPTVFLINTAGKVIYSAEIEIDYDLLKKEIADNTNKLKKKVIAVIIASAGLLLIALMLYLVFIKGYGMKGKEED